MEKLLQYESCSEQDTYQLGQKIGKLITSEQIILLSGELGTGKTVFCKGLAGVVGIKDEITSPTYTLVNEYEGVLPLYHMDLYRLNSEQELWEIGFEDYLEKEAIFLIEWPQLAQTMLPPDYLLIKFKRTGINSRRIEILARGNGELYQQIKQL